MNKLILSAVIIALVSCSSPQKPQETAEPAERQPSAANSRVYDLYGFKVPLHDLEQVPPEEGPAIDGLNEIMMALFKNEYGTRGSTKDEASGMVVHGTRRGVHPRSHGCVKGSFTVSKNLDMQAGIFQPGATYPVTARFSNGSPKVSGDDRSVDTRGFAMKVHQVGGHNLIKSPYTLGEETTQDFTLNSSEPFFSDTAERYAQFMHILTLEAPNLEAAGKMFIKKLLLDGHPIIAARVTKAFLRIQGLKATTPLGMNYFSITPFQYGAEADAPIVKYKMEPCQGVFAAPVNPKDRFFLHTNLKSRMKSHGACFKFMVQQRVKQSWSVEDPSVSWPESKAPFTEIARIQFPKQDLMDEPVCEKLVINPWNTLLEHKPVGGINRIRLPTYLLSTQKRRETNKY